jgi:hypothetical protein
VERIVPHPTNNDILAARAAAEQAVIAQGADPAGVEVDVTVDPQRNLIVAIATGATELRAKDRAQVTDESEVREEVARTLGVATGEVRDIAGTAHHRVLGASTKRPGFLGLHSKGAHVEAMTVGDASGKLAALVDEHTHVGDGGSRAPAVWLLVGPKIADLSGVLDRDQLVALIGAELSTRGPDEALVAIAEDRR